MTRATRNQLLGLVLASLVCVCLALRAAAQDPKASDLAARAVVELLAVGPAENQNNRECGGTGFFVNEQGYILTNAHVVDDAERCLGRGRGTKMMARLAAPGKTTANAVSCDPVGVDRAHDVAVLKIERPLNASPPGEPLPFLRLSLSEVTNGAAVTVAGYPLFAWNAITQSGKVSRRANQRLSKSSPESSEVLVLNISLRPGNSGSPVYLDSGGGVVGVVEGRESSSETLAVPVRYAVELLNHLKVEWRAAGELK